MHRNSKDITETQS